MKTATLDGRAVFIVNELAVDAESASAGLLPSDPAALLDRWADAVHWFKTASPQTLTGQPFEQELLGPPSPRPRQVFAVASNYRGRPAVLETSEELPVVFTKFPSSIVGPRGDLTLPTDTVDWEVEVVAVIGRRSQNVPASQAWDVIAGLTVGQDYSERTLQLGTDFKQFSLGKSFPGFGPTGPCLVTPDEFEDRNNIALRCDVDGQTVQSGQTSQMIFSIPELVARISTICELLPGDLIFTGTPGGLGMLVDPPRYLKPGNVVVGAIEGVGELRNVCIAS